MTHRACRSRARTGQLTATGPVTSTCLHDRWGRVEATQTALGEALAIRRRTRVRFPPPPPTKGSWRNARTPCWRKGPVAAADSGGHRPSSYLGVAPRTGGARGRGAVPDLSGPSAADRSSRGRGGEQLCGAQGTLSLSPHHLVRHATREQAARRVRPGPQLPAVDPAGNQRVQQRPQLRAQRPDGGELERGHDCPTVVGDGDQRSVTDLAGEPHAGVGEAFAAPPGPGQRETDEDDVCRSC